jgi:tetrapyrrole methylase family protein/MazG family protein
LALTDSEYSLDRLVAVMQRLRAPGGCPWDREQTHESLKPYLLEEAYEVFEAVDEGKMYKLCEELGDLLLQVVFHAQLAAERGDFDLNDIIEGIVEKLVRRHPHVFGEVEVEGAAEVLVNWEAIKKREQEERGGSRGSGDPAQENQVSLLNGIPRELPALARAYRLQERAARVGFDWPEVRPVVHKVFEEARELRQAWRQGSREVISSELGDLLFALVNVARFLEVRPEFALAGANDRFQRRFGYMERRAAETGRELEQMTLSELNELWEEAKLEQL